MKRPNLTVRTRAHATGLVFEGKRAVGVRYRKGGRDGAPVEVRARREVILSGGTFNSPQLLQMSGVGPPALLASLGIEVRHALPGVGENLRDHYAPRFAVRVKNMDTINERSRGLRLAAEIFKWCVGGQSILGLSPTQVYCFWKSEPALETSDIQLTFTPASYREGMQGQLELEPGMTAAPWQQRPESKGHVRIRSADPFEQPLIQPNYLTEETDRRVLVAAMRLARRLLQSKPLEPYYDSRGFSRAAGAERRRNARRREGARHHDLPPDGHLPHGAGLRSDQRGRRSVARARPRRLARRRRLDHADDALRQHQRRHHDDRRQGLGPHPRQGGAAADHPEAVNRRLRPTGLMASGHLIAS